MFVLQSQAKVMLSSMSDVVVCEGEEVAMPKDNWRDEVQKGRGAHTRASTLLL